MRNAIDPNSVPDLGKQAELAAERKRFDQEQAQIAAEAEMILWDRSMNRAFKGILDGPTRRRMLVQAAERYEEHA